MQNPRSFLKFDPNIYRQHMSDYGKSICDFMIGQWKQEQEFDRKRELPRSFLKEQKRVLTFNPSDTDIRHGMNTTAYDYDPPMDIELLNPNDIIDTNGEIMSPVPFIPCSSQLVKRAKNLNFTDYSRKDLLFNRLENNNYILDNSTMDIDKNNILTSSDILSSNHILTKSIEHQGVQWDNMFDVEKLPSPTETQIESNNVVLPINHTGIEEKVFNIEFPKPAKHPKKFKPKIQILSNEIVANKTVVKKINKRKNHTKNNDDVPSSKQKISNQVNTKLEKNKKVDMIQNWVDEVNANNQVEEDLVKTKDGKELQQSVDVTEISNTKLKEKAKTKINKKVVQSVLSNKQGVMKFTKPAEDIQVNDEKKNENEVDTEKQEEKNIKPATVIDTKKSKIKTMDILGKNSKIKPKFIVPIKSQIPVKEIFYDIVTYNNIHEIQKLRSECIYAVIIYSNGFCQLNSQHTDDTCIPEGIMFYDGKTYYYLKKTIPMDDRGNARDIIMNKITKKNIICYDSKLFLIYLSKQYNIEVKSYEYDFFDVKIGASLIDPDKPPENFNDIQTLSSFTPEYTIATECILQKSAWYLSLLQQCSGKLRSLMIDQLLWTVFTDIEMRLVPIIADMECRGVSVDLMYLKNMEVLLLNKMKVVEQECYKAAGKSFQLNSTVQVRNILYEELKLDTKCNVKIRETISTGAKSTSETMLRSLMSEHPLPKFILEYRHLHKAHATFLTGIAQHIKNNVIRPNWDQMAAATGRIASNNPNLQAIPKVPFNLVMFPNPQDHPETLENQVINFRSVYVAREGHILLAADFQHVECRVFAHVAADRELLEVLRREDDFFKILAAKWLKKTESNISVEDREKTKRIVYASMYGAGTRKLMEILQISYEETLSVISSFNRTFPSLKSFGRSVVARCVAEEGRVTTICGRVRKLKNISSVDFALKSQAERQAINFVIQGSAADLCKLAMVVVEERLKASSPRLSPRLLLQIHDELVWEIPQDQIHHVAVIVKEEMEGCGKRCGMSVPLPVALATGHTWGDLKPYSLSSQLTSIHNS